MGNSNEIQMKFNTQIYLLSFYFIDSEDKRYRNSQGLMIYANVKVHGCHSPSWNLIERR